MKPSNLLVDPNGLIKIADFGIATTHEIVDQSGVSQLIRGTPAYMAPEQRWGDSSARDVLEDGDVIISMAGQSLDFYRDAERIAAEAFRPEWREATMRGACDRVLVDAQRRAKEA